MVALLLGSGVLIGMAAFAVDVGNLYAERTQLLNGADAAALKVAQVCADPATEDQCNEISANAVAKDYANDNANDGSAAASVCGRGGTLPTPTACPKPSGELAACILDAPATGNYAEVHTSTELQDGTTLLPSIFAQAVFGGFDGAQVHTCARAAWGPPARANGLGVTISVCDWKDQTKEGLVLPSAQRVIPLYDVDAPDACGIAGTSATNVGGFRWLEDADEGCRSVVSVNNSYGVRTGVSSYHKCEDDLNALIDAGRPVAVPLYDAVTGTGGGTREHRVIGFAAFVVTGWRVSYAGSTFGSGPSCPTSAAACLSGYFTRALVPGGGAVGGPEWGARIVARAG